MIECISIVGDGTRKNTDVYAGTPPVGRMLNVVSIERSVGMPGYAFLVQRDWPTNDKTTQLVRLMEPGPFRDPRVRVVPTDK